MSVMDQALRAAAKECDELKRQLDAAIERAEKAESAASMAQCAWCGASFERDANGAIIEHVRSCSKRNDAWERQLRAAEAEADSLRAALRQCVEALEKFTTGGPSQARLWRFNDTMPGYLYRGKRPWQIADRALEAARRVLGGGA